MSFYELEADANKYYYFQHRNFFVTSAHVHGAVEFLFVEKGCQQVIIDGEEFTVNAGEGCFYDSFCVHAYDIDSGASGYILLGAREYFENFFKLSEGKVPPTIFKFSDFSLLEKLKSLFDAPYSSPSHKQAFFSGAISVILSSIATTNKLILPKKKDTTSLIVSVLIFAEQNYQEDLTINFLSKKFGYSREHFSRTLKKYLNEPWNDYLNRLRVKRADALIKEGKTVIDAALSCGFCSPNTFYRAYKKVFNKSPKEK
jgi:AraC-like DNA-binding protein